MSRAHRAVLRLTGWPREVPGGVEIAGVTIRTRWVPPIPARRTSVTVNLSTTNDGAVHRLRAHPSRFGPAQCPNGTQLRVTGQLLRIDTSEGLVRVKVSPDSPTAQPFTVTLHGTQALLAQDPSAASVHVTGRVLTVAGRVGLALADTLDVVHAPVPAHWKGWRPRHRWTLQTTAATQPTSASPEASC